MRTNAAILLVAMTFCDCSPREGAAPSSVRLEPLRVYGAKIIIPADGGKDLRASVTDVAEQLASITGVPFSAESTGDRGIVLWRTDMETAPPEATARLAGAGREAFVIHSTDESRLVIVANADEGLRHGLYFFLEQLGARFYFPNERWTILPRRRDISLKVDRLVAPDFRLHDFFGTGGLGPPFPIDPKQELAGRWATWKARNRFGGDISIQGHSGEAFNTAKKAVLLEHPEYLASVDGSFVPWSANAKLNVANEDAVRLYVAWTIDRYRAQRVAEPGAPRSFAVSVEPSDGGGYCNSPACRAIGDGSTSDQVFFIANAAARSAREAFPDGRVSLLAYASHALPPSFPLESNVYVMVAPYAFQSTGLTADQLIEAWRRKVSRMSVYDYWQMADWGGDEPALPRRTITNKLALWRRSGVEGFLGESTYSAGAMGLAWFVASRVMWNGATDTTALVDEFYDKAFGAARKPMQRMLVRWNERFLLTGHELALSYRDIQEAVGLAGNDAAVLARISDYARYVDYLRLRLVFTRASGDARTAAAKALISHAWNIYDSAMVHAYRQSQLAARSHPDIEAAYDPRDAQAAGWKAVTPVANADALRGIDVRAREWKPLPFVARGFDGKLVHVPPKAFEQVKPPATYPDLLFIGTTVFTLEVGAGQTSLTFSMRSQRPTRIQVSDAGGSLLFDREFPATEWPAEWRKITLPLGAPSVHQIRFATGSVDHVGLRIPTGTALNVESVRTSKGNGTSRLFFYVPKGVRTLAAYEEVPLPESMHVRFFDSAGKPAPHSLEEDGRLYLVRVPAGEDGRVWSLENVVAPNAPLQLLDAPTMFALDPAMLLVPEDALHP